MRKSKWTGRGESIENQIFLCREYIEKYIENSREAQILVYRDEGFSGKDTNRPQFQKMLADMKLRPFQYLVCYRLDRLGRNLADLALLIEKLNREHTEFVSIRERFDTSTPMGKAMVYFSGVLAQMEREQIGERVRDNMYLLAKSGRWLGGNTPLGFQVREKLYGEGKLKKAFYLEVKEKEAEIPRLIFREFLDSHSLTKTAELLVERQIFTRRDRIYTPEAIGEILENPVYCQSGEKAYEYFASLGCQMGFSREEIREEKGLISYGRTVSSRYRGQEASPQEWIIAQGEHEGMISQEDFLRVQKLLKRHRLGKPGEGRVQNEACLLSGFLFCSCGCRMRPKYYRREQITTEGQRKFSYRCPCRDKTRGRDCQEIPLLGNLGDCLVWKFLMKKTGEEFSLEEIFLEIRRRTEKEKSREGEWEKIRKEAQGLEREARRLTQRLAETEDGDLAEFLKKEIQSRLAQREYLREKANGEKNSFNKKERENIARRYSDPKFLSSCLSVPNKRAYLGLWAEKLIWEGGVLKLYLFVSPELP
ncbi:recombinase family protein [Blautia sp. An81]|uniref:recombinase family protein n=1 Tax=Blautia sp. An81 TaxID=1965659 RepID=UPI00194E6E90|nr:recombinase family protein [Blautia sp. An81]